MGHKRNPCPMCDHVHIHKLSCTTQDCECPGTEKWFDWVAVALAVTGRINQVGRSLSKAERRAAAQELLKHGAGIHTLSEQLRVSSDVARQLIHEIRDEDDEEP